MSKETAPRPPELPRELRERYEALGLLGAGGFGQVFEARDRQLDRSVAIKLSQPSLDPELLARFEREARTLGRLEHPSIVRLFDHGVTEDGAAYLVMERVEGTSLAETPAPDPTETMVELAGALEALHQEGLVHRDVKPANILRDQGGRAVLVDLGLVHVEGRSTLTATGQILGSPRYMAPEVIRGQPCTPATDWYAWGVSLYEQLEGSSPFPPEVVTRLVTGLDLPPLRFRRVDPEGPHAELLRRALSEDPARRPATAREIRDILSPRRVRTTRPAAAKAPVPAPPGDGRLRWGVASLALLAAGALLVPWPGEAPAPPPPSPAASAPAPPSVAEELAALVRRRLEKYPTGPEGVLLMRDHAYSAHTIRLMDRTLRADFPLEERRWRGALAAWIEAPTAGRDEELVRDVLRLVWLETIEREMLALFLRFQAYFTGTRLGALLTPRGFEDDAWARMPSPPGLLERAEAEQEAWATWARRRTRGPEGTRALRRALRRLLLLHPAQVGGSDADLPEDVGERLARSPGELGLLEVFDLLASFDWMRASYRGECEANARALVRLGEHLEALESIPADLLAMARATLAISRYRNLARCSDIARAEELESIRRSLQRLPDGWVELGATWCLGFLTFSPSGQATWSEEIPRLIDLRARAQERLRGSLPGP